MLFYFFDILTFTFFPMISVHSKGTKHSLSTKLNEIKCLTCIVRIVLETIKKQKLKNAFKAILYYIYIEI